MESSNYFPFDIEDVGQEEAAEIAKYFNGEDAYVRVGPKKYFMGAKYKDEAAKFYNMPVRHDDVFIVTYPRTGTTLTSEMIWLVANNVDFEKAASQPLVKRFPYIDQNTINNESETKRLLEYNKNNKNNTELIKFILGGTETVKNLPSPRFLKTHLPMSLLPPQMLDTAKVVYVARDPRDVAVSYYNLSKLALCFDYHGDFKTFWRFFKNDRPYSSYLEHLKEAWEMRNHPNMLFLFYNDIIKDLPAAIKRMVAFLDKELTDSQIEQLSSHLGVENFKKNPSVNGGNLYEIGMLSKTEKTSFVRKGKSGGWREYFDEELAADAERWIAEGLRGTGLHFPDK